MNSYLLGEEKDFDIILDFETSIDIKKRPVFGVLIIKNNKEQTQKKILLKSEFLKNIKIKGFDEEVILEEVNPITYLINLIGDKTARVIGHNLAFDIERWLAYSEFKKHFKEVFSEENIELNLGEQYLFSRWINTHSEKKDKYYNVYDLKPNKRLKIEFIDTVRLAKVLQFTNCKLSALSEELDLEFKKQEFSNFEINQQIINRETFNKKILDKEIKYCEYDVKTTYALYEELKKQISEVLEIIQELSGEFGIQYFQKKHKYKLLQFLSHSTAKFTDLYLVSLAKTEETLLKIQQKNKEYVTALETLGGRTRAYKHGVYKDVCSFDFESLYPSVMKQFGFSKLLIEPQRISINYNREHAKIILKQYVIEIINYIFNEVESQKNKKYSSFQGLIKKTIDYLQISKDKFILPSSKLIINTKDYFFTEGVISNIKNENKSEIKPKTTKINSILPLNQEKNNNTYSYNHYKKRNETSYKLFEAFMKGKGIQIDFLGIITGIISDILTNYVTNKQDLSKLKQEYRQKYEEQIDNIEIIKSEIYEAKITSEERRFDEVYKLLSYKRKFKEEKQHTKSKACKIIMNASYGKSANQSFLLYNRLLSSCITIIGRYSHRLIEVFSEFEGLNLVYADTDSIYISDLKNGEDVKKTSVVRICQGFSFLEFNKDKDYFEAIAVLGKKRYILKNKSYYLKLAGLKSQERPLYLFLAKKIFNKETDIDKIIEELEQDFILNVLRGSVNINKNYSKKGFYYNIQKAVEQGKYKNKKDYEYICLEGKHTNSLNTTWFNYILLQNKCLIYSGVSEAELLKGLSFEDRDFLKNKLKEKIREEIKQLSIKEEFLDGFYYDKKQKMRYVAYNKTENKEEFIGFNKERQFLKIKNLLKLEGVDKIKSRGLIIFENYLSEGVIRHLRSSVVNSFKDYLIKNISRKKEVSEKSRVLRTIKEETLNYLQIPFIICENYKKGKGIIKDIGVEGYKLGEYEKRPIVIMSSLHRKVVPHGFFNIGFTDFKSNNTLPVKLEFNPNRFNNLFNVSSRYADVDIQGINTALFEMFLEEMKKSIISFDTLSFSENNLEKILQWVYLEDKTKFEEFLVKSKIDRRQDYKSLIKNLLEEMRKQKNSSYLIKRIIDENNAIKINGLVYNPYEIHFNKEVVVGSQEFKAFEELIFDYKKVLEDNIFKEETDVLIGEIRKKKEIIFNERDKNVYLRDVKNKIGLVLYSKKDAVVKDIIKILDNNKGKAQKTILDIYRPLYEKGVVDKNIYRFEVQIGDITRSVQFIDFINGWFETHASIFSPHSKEIEESHADILLP